MSLSDAIFFAALVTIVCAIGIAEKIIDVDMDQFLPENLKKAKIKRIFVERNTPLQGTNVQKEIKKAFESVLLPLGKADKSQGIKQLMAGAGIMLLGTTLIPQLATLFS